MSGWYLILTPVLMLGVVALAAFVGCHLVFQAEPSPEQRFVTSTVLGGVRNDFTGWVGMSIDVGPAPIQVVALGRTMVSASVEPHVVKIVRAVADGGGEDLGFVTIPVTSEPADFAYADLNSPVMLAPSERYYIVTHEVAGTDSWHHSDTTVTATNIALVSSAVFNDDANPRYFLESTLNHTFGPVDFKHFTS